MIFYTPFDIGYKIAKFLPVKIVCATMKEIYRWVHNNKQIFVFYLILLCLYYFAITYRCKKVYDGVSHAGKLYPNAYLIMVLIGTLKGNF